jgi:hypothetical protein
MSDDPTHIGGFTLRGHIGSGGMGRVYVQGVRGPADPAYRVDLGHGSGGREGLPICEWHGTGEHMTVVV